MTRTWIRVVVPGEDDVPLVVAAFNAGALQDRDYEVWLAAGPVAEVLRAWRRGGVPGSGGELSEMAKSLIETPR